MKYLRLPWVTLLLGWGALAANNARADNADHYLPGRGVVTPATPSSRSLPYQLGTQLTAAIQAAHITDRTNSLRMFALASGRFVGPAPGYFFNQWGANNLIWNPHFWLRNFRGYAATSVSVRNVPPLGYGATLISPRHFLSAGHLSVCHGFFTGRLRGQAGEAQWIGTNNVTYLPHCIAVVTHRGYDILVGLLDRDMPAAVGFLPVLSSNMVHKLSGNWQGIGFSQRGYCYPESLQLAGDASVVVYWSPATTPYYGLPAANWGICSLGPGDSGNPVRVMLGGQLVLVSAAFRAASGPNYSQYIDLINADMHYLSTNNNLHSDYQLSILDVSGYPDLK